MISRGTRRVARQIAPVAGEAGLTLIELIVACSLMLILSVMALPVARVRIQREKERLLRMALHEMRQAIDRHKDMADNGELGGLDPDNYGYPKTLEGLVEGVPLDSEADGMPMGPGGRGVSQGRGVRPGTSGGISPRLDRSSSNPFGSSRDGPNSEPLIRQGDFFAMGSDPLGEERQAPEAIRFLRSIPVDPMTGQREWGKLSMSDDPMSRSWSGRNVFDVYSLSSGIALDGTRYSEW